MTEDGMRAITMTPQLLRDMTRDVATLLLRTRHAVALWGVMALAIVVVTRPTDAFAAVVVCVAVPALALAMVVGTRRSVRRALVAAFAPGTTVWARVEPDALRMSGALGSSQTSLSAYREVRVRGSAAVLRLRGSRTFVVVPSALLTDEDLGLLGAAVVRD
ncbi:hypothetical protein [Cellulomonas xiejunii]|nr:hypothetical protein [Cellulomonas xiejunii]MCC2316208.1 hypothetical protein [Cellulomonas xiejunii]